jgi:hypothetical protein
MVDRGVVAFFRLEKFADEPNTGVIEVRMIAPRRNRVRTGACTGRQRQPPHEKEPWVRKPRTRPRIFSSVRELTD